MARGDSQRAIGAVTRLLSDHLSRRGFTATVGKPEDAADTDTSASKLNLFLYEVSFDGAMRNISLEDGRPPPVWLVLKYLLTAFDDTELSDSADAHELLGRGVMALNDLNYLRLDAAVQNDVRLALELNPEPLKITFDEGSSELLSRLMQGSEEEYRLSAALQVRPVLLMPAEPEPLSQLVGIDYSQSPAAPIGVDGLQLDALSSLGAIIDRIEPAIFDPGEVITVFGTDLHLAGLEAMLGDQTLRVTSQTSEQMTVEIEGTPTDGGPLGPIAAGRSLSAGEHGLKLVQRLPNGRLRSSNLLTGSLRPVVSGATLAAPDVQMTGTLLGGADDDVTLTMLAEDGTAQNFETVVTAADQQTLTVTGAGGVPAGRYLALLRVGRVQARVSPTVVVP